jgi:hypothetical protein
MNRRFFLGLIGGMVLLPGKVFANRELTKWWKERDFVFEGTPTTEYIWPKDRMISLSDDEGFEMWVPPFQLDDPRLEKITIEDHMREIISTDKELAGWRIPNHRNHLHVIRIAGMPMSVGLCTAKRRLAPTVDCYAKTRNYQLAGSPVPFWLAKKKIS